jgi:hypothetical protein
MQAVAGAEAFEVTTDDVFDPSKIFWGSRFRA